LPVLGRETANRFEIGGGYGGLALLWMTIPRPIPISNTGGFPRVAVFHGDIPEGQPAGCPLLYVESARRWRHRMSRRTTTSLCPSDLRGRADGLQLDLVINLYSFQEMNDAGLDHWMVWLERQACRFLYSIQTSG